ncbi:cyclic nucleotide-gated ion channel 2-like [Dorcoceras hygrometricum]|uniref:Cyclic nucleotide-gated ion channel 2-like n=1 Tax=Dorcoceras hygrometricum TaxID=472368 RepID=A0A2Z7CF24_9LAMI|nr:cyclic nucleotide-gated ion channel 2-like [Dorcoceras hygrometricum]
MEDSQISTAGECYACTRVSVPVFHSASWDDADHHEWEASAGSFPLPITKRLDRETLNTHLASDHPSVGIFDPRSKGVRRWNRAILLARSMALAVDPLFFYVVSIGRGGSPCLYVDGGLVAIATVLRVCLDSLHLCHMWLQFRLAFVPKESLVIGCGKLEWDTRAIAAHYLRSLNGFWFDVFVILPVPQAVFWLVVPRVLTEDRAKYITMILLLTFLFQFLPKIYHTLSLMRRMQKVTGYIFGTIWWGFGLNLIAYFIASHVVGGCWYILAIQRVGACFGQRCNTEAAMLRKPLCLDVDGSFGYGIYTWALPVVSSNSVSVKILYPICWGMLTLSTFGNNLEPTSDWKEVMFSICLVLSGLLLFTLLIGNIQVFLHAVMAKKREMHVRCRDMEWWMKRRQLPLKLRQRVRHYERQRWTILGGNDGLEFISDLPEGLRRDINRFLCLDLIKKVPLFHTLDDLIQDNICDRAKPLVFSKGEKIIREGDLVQMIVFIVRGRAMSRQNLSRGIVATNILEPGTFFGDELLSWCLRRPFMDRLPHSSATFTCLESTEAFALEASHLRYITDHFRNKFVHERVRRTARYYSSNWRTWGAVNIQLAWRRYMLLRNKNYPVCCSGIEDDDRRLRQYAAFFMSFRPHDHLE